MQSRVSRKGGFRSARRNPWSWTRAWRSARQRSRDGESRQPTYSTSTRARDATSGASRPGSIFHRRRFKTPSTSRRLCPPREILRRQQSQPETGAWDGCLRRRRDASAGSLPSGREGHRLATRIGRDEWILLTRDDRVRYMERRAARLTGDDVAVLQHVNLCVVGVTPSCTTRLPMSVLMALLPALNSPTT